MSKWIFILLLLITSCQTKDNTVLNAIETETASDNKFFIIDDSQKVTESIDELFGKYWTDKIVNKTQDIIKQRYSLTDGQYTADLFQLIQIKPLRISGNWSRQLLQKKRNNQNGYFIIRNFDGELTVNIDNNPKPITKKMPIKTYTIDSINWLANHRDCKLFIDKYVDNHVFGEADNFRKSLVIIELPVYIEFRYAKNGFSLHEVEQIGRYFKILDTEDAEKWLEKYENYQNQTIPSLHDDLRRKLF